MLRISRLDQGAEERVCVNMYGIVAAKERERERERARERQTDRQMNR